MNKQYCLNGFFALLIMACCSCMPYHFTSRPGVTGTVTDANESRPLEGAMVTLTVLRSIEHEGEILSTSTGADGNFQIPAAQRWSIYMVPLDPAHLTALVTIKLLGYQDITKGIFVTTMGPAMTDLGRLIMERQKE